MTIAVIMNEQGEFLVALAIAALVLLVFALALEIAAWVLKRRTWRLLVKQRDCEVCAKRGTMECPNSSLCYSRTEKPYFEEDDYERY